MGQFWHEQDDDLATKPEFLRVKRKTQRSEADVGWHLGKWFSLVNSLGESLGNEQGQGLVRGYSLEDLTDLLGLDDVFWAAVRDVGWIIEDEDGLIVPKFDDRFGKLARCRASKSNTQRVRRAEQRVVKQAEMMGEQQAAPSRAGDQTAPPRDAAGPSTARPATRKSADAVAARGAATPLRPLTDPPVTHTALDVPVTAGTVTAAALPPGHAVSQFDQLTVADLGSGQKLREWVADCAGKRLPLVLDDEFHLVRVVAAAHRATNTRGVRAPMALFKSIVAKRRWTMLEETDIRAAKMKLDNLKQLATTRSEARHDLTRASPVEGLALTFGMVPHEPQRQTREEAAVALLRWDARRSKTG